MVNRNDNLEKVPEISCKFAIILKKSLEMMQSQQGTNWKNVNNWHWVEKNCLPWTQEFLANKLCTFEFKNDSCHVWISAVKSVEGDVDLNQRKGKLLNIYDLILNLEWKGVALNDLEKQVKGSIHVPEWMHDSDSLEWKVDMESWTRENDFFLVITKTKLCPLIEKYLLEEFSKELISGIFY